MTVNQSVDHSIDVSKPINDPGIRQIRNQPTNQSPNQSPNQSINQSTNQSCPQEDAFRTWYKWPSLLTFSWLTPLLSLGVKRSLQIDDVWLPWKKERSEHCESAFNQAWETEVERVRILNQSINQSISHQSINQPHNQSVSQSINQSKDQSNGTSASQPINSVAQSSSPFNDSKSDKSINQSINQSSINQSINHSEIQPSLGRVAWRLIRWDFFLAAVIHAYSIFDQLIGPQILKKLTEYSYESSIRDVPAIDGYKWALYMFGSAIIGALSRSLSLHFTARIFIRLRNMLILAIYQKSLKIPIKGRDDGKINNMMSADSQKVVELSFAIHNLWSAPIIIAVGVYQIWIEVSWPAILGLTVMLLFLPISGILMGLLMIYQQKASAETDRRISLITEIIQGIKVIKLSAWGVPFLESVDRQRDRELTWLRKFAVLQSVTFGSLMIVPVLMSVTIFGVHVAIGGDMSPTTVFTTLALVNIIRMPMTFLPMALGGLAQTLVAINRMGEFMNLPELIDPRIKLDDVTIKLDQAQFTWGEPKEAEKKDEKKKDDQSINPSINEKKKDEIVNQSINQSINEATKVDNESTVATVDDQSINQSVKRKAPPRLTDINLSINQGELALVLGKVGAGKSTLLYGMLGEVDQSFGETSIGGKIAYVPQTAFIVNASLRENVVFGEPFDSARYDRVIHACALIADINLLPNGDLTEIGERGINLSGGQKQRISIARAAYNMTADIVLLDDPLSAVDMHVAQHIFTHCINGVMKDRLRVLVTHSMAFVDQADTIILLKETEVKDSFTATVGNPKHMKENDSEYQSLLERYHSGINQSDDDEAVKSRAKNKKSRESKENQSNVLDAGESDKKADLTDEEERGVGTISWKMYLYYIKAGGSPLFYGAVACLFLLVLGAQLGADFTLSEWSNDLFTNERPTGFWLGLYGGLIAVSLCFTISRTTCVALFGIRAARTMHHNLARSVMSKSMSWFDRTPSGRIVNRFSKDMYIIDLMMAFMIEFALATTLDCLGIIIVIAVIVPIALAMFAVLAVVYVMVANYFRKSNRDLQRIESVTRTPIFSHFSESLIGMASIRACKVQDMYVAENKARVNENTRGLYFSQAVPSWLQLRLDVIGAVIVGGSAALAVASPHIDGAVSTGSFGLLVTYALSASGLLNASVTLLSQVEAQMNSIERVHFYSQSMDEEVNESLDPAINQSIKGGQWPSKGQISIKQLQLRYREDLDLVLKAIDLEIPGGQRVGIVGRTGSGKSSLLVALFRLVEPCGGSITVDGVNLSHIDSNEIRANFAIIPQDAFLFQGSVKYNLDPHGVYSDEELWTALEYVQLKGVVERMGSALMTPITDAGNSLSIGQKQLLCMARALLKKPKLICLDEATASVDLETDSLIQSVIRRCFNGSTVITIAHRLNTILDYDMIVVMDNGIIAELGSPQQLIEANGIFASMLHDKKED